MVSAPSIPPQLPSSHWSSPLQSASTSANPRPAPPLWPLTYPKLLTPSLTLNLFPNWRPPHSTQIWSDGCPANSRAGRPEASSDTRSPPPDRSQLASLRVASFPPAFLTFSVSDYLDSAPLITSYADDFTAAASSVKIPDTAATLSAQASDVATLARRKGLTVSIPKSSSTLFSPDPHQSRTDPHIVWEGSDLTLCRTPKSCGSY